MTAITDHHDQFVLNRINEALRKADWHWKELQPGAYVILRATKHHGRIIERIVKNADEEAMKLLRAPYVVYRVRYLDGQIFEEHPEHLDLAKRPVLQSIK